MRHSLMVYRIAIDLFNSYINNQLLNFKNELLFSCLFHDCCKNGIENKKHTEHSHPIIAHDFINKCYYDFSETHPYNKINITIIINTIAKHMGKWTNSKYSNIILPAPEYEEDFFCT